VLTDNDIKVMKDALPNEHDTPDQIAAKVANLKQQSLVMLRDKLAYYQAAHYDTGDLPALYKGAQETFNRQQQHQTTNPELSPAQAAIEHQTRMDKVRAQSQPVPVPPPPPYDTLTAERVYPREPTSTGAAAQQAGQYAGGAVVQTPETLGQPNPLLISAATTPPTDQPTVFQTVPPMIARRARRTMTWFEKLFPENWPKGTMQQ
jgi:hypothetical protein